MLPLVERDIAGPVQDEAVRITVAEAVDTGLMAASWRVRRLPRAVRVGNTAESERDFPYPQAVEWGFRTRNGRHIPGKRILGRATTTAHLLNSARR